MSLMVPTCAFRISVFFSRTSKLVRLSWMEMQASINFLNCSHSSTTSWRSLVTISASIRLRSTFFWDSSLMLCLNLTSKASFSNRMVSMVSSKQMLFSDDLLLDMRQIYEEMIDRSECIQVWLELMGGVSACGQFCSTGTPTRQEILRNTFYNTLKGSTFQSLCLAILDNHFEEELELENEEFLRTSMVQGNHYEVNSLVNSILTEDSVIMRSSRRASWEVSEDKLPTTIAGMPGPKKEAYMFNLIRESYLFLDISQCLEERQSIQSYQRCMKHELLKEDQSLFQSFISDTTLIDRLEESLKDNHSSMVCLLEGYVHFCRKVKHDFLEEKDRFLGKLSLNIQAVIINKYQQEVFKNEPRVLTCLKNDIQQAIAILVLTIQTLYQIKIAPLTETSQVTSNFNFYNEMNLYTMVTTLFFQNQHFTDFVLNRIELTFNDRYLQYRREPEYRTKDFIEDLVNLTCQGVLPSRNRSQLTSLFDPEANKYSQLPIFQNSLRILPKVLEKSQPLYKLKIVYELNREMNKEMEKLKQALFERYKVEVGSVFNREVELLMVKWMLNQVRLNVSSIASHLLFTYFFIHRLYRIDKKGSCLTTFMQEVERIIKWTEQQ